ncbi:MAG: caspase family protein [Myxococcales bacterium]|nr:caspase family protein [Myxococcales bacterium]
MLCWFALLAAAALADDAPRRFALVVGSNEGLPGEAPLRYADDDAQRFADALVRVGDVRQEDLVLLRDAPASAIGRALDDLAGRTRASPESVMILFYSGHASEHALHVGGEAVALQPLVQRMARMDSQVELLVVDACGSGALTRRKGVVKAEPFQLDLGAQLDTEGMAILTSSSPGEDAQESEHLRGGVFTHHLVTGLLGAADDSGDGLVTLTEAYQYGYDQTVRTTSTAPTLQHPAFDIQLRGQRDLVVSRLDRSASSRLHLGLAGTWLLLDEGSGELVAEVSVDAPVALVLRPGRYLLRRRHEGEVFEATAEVAPGRLTHLRPESLQRVSAGRAVRKGYAPERPTAAVLLAGGGVGGAYGVGEGLSGLGHVGLRLDTRALSVSARLSLDRQGATVGSLRSRQTTWGLDLSVLRMQHVASDDLVVGVGVRTGAAVVSQRFDGRGTALPQTGLVGHVGSVLRAETILGSRVVVALFGGVDALAWQRMDRSRVATVRPFAAMEVGTYL